MIGTFRTTVKLWRFTPEQKCTCIFALSGEKTVHLPLWESANSFSRPPPPPVTCLWFPLRSPPLRPAVALVPLSPTSCLARPCRFVPSLPCPHCSSPLHRSPPPLRSVPHPRSSSLTRAISIVLHRSPGLSRPRPLSSTRATLDPPHYAVSTPTEGVVATLQHLFTRPLDAV